MNIALILAGGQGTRAKAAVPKQFVEIKGKPMIVYTLEKFQNCRSIDRICIVCSSEWNAFLLKAKESYSLDKLALFAEAGLNGLESAWKGICSLKDYPDSDLVMIHDAVRPFVDGETILDSIRVAEEYGCALSSIPCVETMVRTREDLTCSEEMVPRDQLFRILTPQTFRLGILRNLFRDFDPELGNKYPSVFAYYMSLGNPVYLSKGCERNIKITYPEDIEYFRKLFE